MSKNPKQKYFQHNYIKVIENYVPQVYFEDEILSYDSEKDIIYEVMHKNALLAIDMSTYVLSVDNLTVTGLAQHFIASNELTKITPHNLQEKLFGVLSYELEAAGYPSKISEYETSANFKKALTEVILPHILTNNPTATWNTRVEVMFPTVSSVALSKKFLVDNFSFIYFLNRDAGVAGFEPQEGVIELLTHKTYLGKTITLKDCIKKLYKFLWDNTDTQLRFAAYIPSRLNKSTSGYDELGTSSWTSGVQQYEKLITLIDIIYNEKDSHSTYLRDSIVTLLEGGYIEDVHETKGPFLKLLKAYGCSLYDIKTLMDDLGDLVDIDSCPKEFFDHLARYIGWNLNGDTISEWRNQLRQAIFVYKSKGTKEALTGAIHSLFPVSIFNPMQDLLETWESYIPFLLYYILKTESPVFNTDLPTEYNSTRITTPRKCAFGFLSNAYKSLGMTFNMPNRMDTALRSGVDYLIARMQSETNELLYNNKPWKLKVMHDLGRDTLVPPFERDNYYRFQNGSDAQMDSFRKWLLMPTCDGGFEVPVSAVNAFHDYILSASVNNTLKVGLGNKWKFFSNTAQLPFNRDILIKNGKAAVQDYWNSKSSTVFLELQMDDYMFKTDAHPWGKEATDLIGATLKDFVPFTVIVNLRFLKSVSSPNTTSGFDCRAWEARPKNTPEVNEGVLDSTYQGGFRLASGLGFILNNNLGNSIDYKIVGEARNLQYLPPPSSTTWRNTSNPTPAGALITTADHIRNTVRRKNLLNRLPIEDLHFRDGKAQPITMQFMSASGVLAAHSTIMNTSEYNPKGFDYAKNKIVALNQYLQARNGYVTVMESNPIWDASVGLEPSEVFYEIATSSMFPIRDANTTLCASGLRARNLMNPGWFELWKINDAHPTSSTNITIDPNFVSGLNNWTVTKQG